MEHNYSILAYLISGVFFILALRGLSSPETARRGNIYGISGMVIAIVATLLLPGIESYVLIVLGILIGGIIGTSIALKIKMTALPQLIAGFHSLVGLAAVMVAGAAFHNPSAYGIGDIGNIPVASLIEMSLGSTIGAITFSGSIIAFGKLQGIMSGNPITFKFQHFLNAILGIVLISVVILFCLNQTQNFFWSLTILAFIIGFLIIIPIGGADMPVVVSMLNSYSGWAACGIGFTLSNNLLIITGALVGSSGAILSYIMCKGMNRSFISVILGGFGGENVTLQANKETEQRPVKSGDSSDAAFMMQNAESVVIVPGYGMAVAQAQHVLKEMCDILKKKGVNVRYAIHPVAGRMPGHMNVLLAEANVPYDEVLGLDEINRDFASTDIVFVIGANDITNPAAKTDPQSPIYGMPILEVENAKSILFSKRSLRAGYAGVENELFFRNNTMMLFGDAKEMCESIINALGK
jgi:NAD(P) transhydrogenase subunit beta